MKDTRHLVWCVFAAVLVFAGGAGAADSWPKRMFDLQNTSNAGDDPKLTPESVDRLGVDWVIPTRGSVNATPVVSDGLLFIGDSAGIFYVVDLETGRRLMEVDTGTGGTQRYSGVHSTALVAEVTVPGGTEKRVYFGANQSPRTLRCLSVSRIRADRAVLDQDPGDDYVCEGADWPIEIRGLGNPSAVYNGSPIFSPGQPIVRPDGTTEERDVVFTPTIGLDCSDGQFWAVDAYSAEVLWTYDPVPNFQDAVQGFGGTVFPGFGGVIWTVAAMSRDREYLYVTTGDCVQQPQVGFQAESIVALDPRTGIPRWHHQRRLFDATDFDTGNSPTVVDVEGPDGCNVVISPDKDGCIYAFPQESDVPPVEDPAFDPLRPDQQRLLWRTCLMPGWGMSDRGGGFNANAASFHDRFVFVQTQVNNTAGIGDDVGYFAIDACDGSLQWTTSSIRPGRSEGAIASGMIFEPSESALEVFTAGAQKEHLATVSLPARSTPGGGGPAVVDGTVYVPTFDGVAVVKVLDAPGVSTPVAKGNDVYSGPFPHPVAPAAGQTVLQLDAPYDWWPEVEPVEEWPSMNPEPVDP